MCADNSSHEPLWLWHVFLDKFTHTIYYKTESACTITSSHCIANTCTCDCYIHIGGNMDTPTTEIMVPNVTNEVPSTTTKAPEDVTTEAPNETIEPVNSIATLPPNNKSNSSAIDTTKLPTPQIFSSVQHESVPHTVSVSVMATDIVATSSSSISTDSTSSVISITSTSTIEQSSTSSPAPTAVVNKVADTTSNDKVMPTSDSGSGPNKDPNSDSRLCGNTDCSNSKAAGLVVACLLVAFLLIVVILVVLKKSWERHRSKRYKRIDYLIDGMYS